MTIETLLPNGDDSGWPTGSFLDIDEGIASADGSIMATTTTDDVLDVDLDDSAIADADTVNSVTIKIHGRTNGAGTDMFMVDLLIGGVPQGVQQTGSNLGGSMATESFNDTGWNIDWTAAQLDGMQVRVTASQTAMPATVGHEIDAIDVDVDYTVAAGGRIMGSLAGQGGLAGSGGLAGQGGGIAG